MQSAQEFIESFLRERAETLRLNRLAFDAFREKFYSNDIVEHYSRWNEERDKHPDSVSIVEITGDTALFITTEQIRGRQWQHRYHVRLLSGRWQIQKEEGKCILCRGSGRHEKKPCRICGGTGWKDYSQRES